MFASNKWVITCPQLCSSYSFLSGSHPCCKSFWHSRQRHTLLKWTVVLKCGRHKSAEISSVVLVPLGFTGAKCMLNRTRNHCFFHDMSSAPSYDTVCQYWLLCGSLHLWMYIYVCPWWEIMYAHITFMSLPTIKSAQNFDGLLWTAIM